MSLKRKRRKRENLISSKYVYIHTIYHFTINVCIRGAMVMHLKRFTIKYRRKLNKESKIISDFLYTQKDRGMYNENMAYKLQGESSGITIGTSTKFCQSSTYYYYYREAAYSCFLAHEALQIYLWNAPFYLYYFNVNQFLLTPSISFLLFS